MKSKNANFFQQHFEKIAIAAAVVISLGVLFWYVIGSPYTADLNGRRYGPQKLEKQVQQRADQLSQALDDKVTPFGNITIPAYTKDFESRLSRNVLPQLQYRMALNRPGLDTKDIGPPAPPNAYPLPHPPVPGKVTARAGFAVFGRFDTQTSTAADIQQYHKLVGNTRPRDFRYVSVSAVFSLQQWRQRLKTATTRGLPHAFWRSLVGISAVYLEREELDPRTGQWGHPTLIKPLPGQIAFLPSHQYDYSIQQADRATQFIKDNQEQVARPQFPPLADNSLWVPPSAARKNLTPEQQRELKKTRDKIARYEKQIKLITGAQARQKQRQQNSKQNRPTRRNRNSAFPGDEAGGPPDLGLPPEVENNRPRRNIPNRTRGNAQDRQKQQLDQLYDRLNKAKAERDSIIGIQTQQSQYGPTAPDEPGGYGRRAPGDNGRPRGGNSNRLNGDLPPPGGNYQTPGGRRGQGWRGRGGGRGGGRRNQGPSPFGPGSENQRQGGQEMVTNIRVWAHDLTVEPGKTYRYRVLVATLNPLFRQSRVAPAQKKKNFNKMSLAPAKAELSQASWSKPVHVAPKYYFFFIHGSAHQVATVEVWRIYDGQWRKKQFQVTPGDPIGGLATLSINGAARKVNMEVGAVVVDITAAAGTGLGNNAHLLYVQPGTQEIATRNVEHDRDSNERIRLQNKAALEQQRAQGAQQQARAFPPNQP